MKLSWSFSFEPKMGTSNQCGVGITNETEVINAFHEPASNGIDEKQTS